VVLLARARGPLVDTAEECRAAGAASVAFFAVDVADAAAVEDAVQQTYRARGGIDVVVQAAGVAAYGRFEDLPAEVFDGVLATNVLGSANVARAVLPRMRADDHGHLLLVGSVIGTIGVPEMTAYVVSKWGIRALARQLQLENRDRPGVRVTLVTPGGVDTPIYPMAANYTGRVGQPPPPVYSPEAVARSIVQSWDNPQRRLNVGVANPLMSVGFALLPWVYDTIVGPLFSRLAKESTEVGPTSGNVLAPGPQGHQLRGRHPGLTRPSATLRSVWLQTAEQLKARRRTGH
jgi:short-subunit dehydrogenase